MAAREWSDSSDSRHSHQAVRGPAVTMLWLSLVRRVTFERGESPRRQATVLSIARGPSEIGAIRDARRVRLGERFVRARLEDVRLRVVWLERDRLIELIQ